MSEYDDLVLTDKQVTSDQVVVTVLGALAGLMAGKLVERTYKMGITSYRLKHGGSIKA